MDPENNPYNDGQPTVIERTSWTSDDGIDEHCFVIGKIGEIYLSGFERSHRGGEPFQTWDWDNGHTSRDAAMSGAIKLYERYEANDDPHLNNPDQKYRIRFDRPHPYARTSPLSETDESKQLFQIEALRDIPEHRVKAGDFGGYIQSHHNLSHDGASWVGENAYVWGKARIEEDGLIRGRATAYMNSRVGGSAVVEGQSLLSGSSSVRGAAHIKDVTLTDRAALAGDIYITSPMVIQGDADYYRIEDIPFDFSKSYGTESDYYALFEEALESDARLQAYFAALGFSTLEEQKQGLLELWTGPDRAVGRNALIGMAQLVGGRFENQEYHPKDAGAIFRHAFSNAQNGTYATALREFRVPDMISNEFNPDRDRETGATVFPCILMATVTLSEGDEPQTVYQPGIIFESAPDATALVPLPGRLETIPASFRSRHDALICAMHHVDRLAGKATDEPKMDNYLDAVSAIDRLPVLWHTAYNETRPNYPVRMRDFTFLVQSSDTAADEADRTALEGFVTLTMRSDMSEFDRYDVGAALRHAASPAPSIHLAQHRATDVHSQTLWVSRAVQMDTLYQQKHLASLRYQIENSRLTMREEAHIGEQLIALDPNNTSVAHLSSIEVFEQPDGSLAIPAAFRFKSSEGTTFQAGSLTVKAGVVTGQRVNAEKFYADPESALAASEQDYRARAAEIGYAPEAAPRPNKSQSQSGPSL